MKDKTAQLLSFLRLICGENFSFIADFSMNYDFYFNIQSTIWREFYGSVNARRTIAQFFNALWMFSVFSIWGASRECSQKQYNSQALKVVFFSKFQYPILNRSGDIVREKTLLMDGWMDGWTDKS